MSENGKMAEAESDIARIERAFVRISARSVRNDVHQRMMRRADCELPRGHIWLLGRLDDDGPARLSDLATALGVDNSTLTPQAQRLEREGLIARDPDPWDSRARLLRVTPAGEELLARLHANLREVFADLLDDWSDAKRATAADILSEFASRMEASEAFGGLETGQSGQPGWAGQQAVSHRS